VEGRAGQGEDLVDWTGLTDVGQLAVGKDAHSDAVGSGWV